MLRGVDENPLEVVRREPSDVARVPGREDGEGFRRVALEVMDQRGREDEGGAFPSVRESGRHIREVRQDAPIVIRRDPP